MKKKQEKCRIKICFRSQKEAGEEWSYFSFDDTDLDDSYLFSGERFVKSKWNSELCICLDQ